MLKFPLLLITLSFASAFALELSGEWRLLPGSDPLEKTAAEMFAEEAAERFGTRPASGAALPALVIGTVETSPRIAAEHAKEPFRFDPSKPESFHAVLRGSTLHIAGATPKGAMNGAFRLLDRNRKNVDGLDLVGIPNFRYRAAGHKNNQSPPPEWSDDDQGKYYARHYINAVWGEKLQPQLPYEVRKKYGLKLMAELRIPCAATDTWWNDPANSEAVFLRTEKDNRRVISPFAPAGRKWYLDNFGRLYRENPDLAVFYGIFGDYNAIPAERSVNAATRAPFGHSREETIIEILKLMREAVGEKSGIVPRAWLWHAFYGRRTEELAFMRKLDSLGFGVMYNEAGNNDDWVIRLNNFDPAALESKDGRPVLGEDYISLVSAGGACESVNPVIGMPLPRVAAHKISLLADAGVNDFVLWWASAEGWTYQPNLEVIAELIWRKDFKQFTSKQFDAALPLLREIAERDFGPGIAPKLLDYYRKFDAALVNDQPLYQPRREEAQGDPAKNGLHIYDWWQRLGIYTEPGFGGPFPEPVTVPALSNAKRFKNMNWGVNPYTIANYEAVLGKLKAVQEEFAGTVAALPAGKSRERLEAMYNWAQLYYLLLESQYLHLKGLYALRQIGENPDPAAARRAVAPVTGESIRNTQNLLAHLKKFAPNMNLTEGMGGAVNNRGSVAKETALLESKLVAMKLWLNRSRNLALNRPVKASSVDSRAAERDAKYAVDGDSETVWSSDYKDGQWIEVDLGAEYPVEVVILGWRNAFAKEFALELSADGKKWTAAYHTADGKDGDMSIPLPPGSRARHIRINCIRRGTPWWGFALREIAVY